MSKLSRSRALVPLAVLALLGAGIAAYAYWTTSGSGSGTAHVATAPSALTVNQTTVLTALYPGGSAQTLSGTFDNPNAGPVYVGTVTVSISSVTKAAGAPAGTCDATDFTLTGAAMAVGAEVPAGSGKGSWTGATLAFNDKPATNQDACQGATVNLAYAVS
jgi:hypothetical protein